MRPKAQLPTLTSLRFFAASLIVAYHSGAILGTFDISRGIAASQGVSFFFVLSGFILAHAYPQLPDRAVILRFYLARFARIWPTHAVTLLVWVIAIYGFSQATILWHHGGLRLVATLALVQSWVPIEVWDTSFNGVSWSISTEAFFYLSFPILIRRFERRWPIIFLVEAGAVGVALFVSSLGSGPIKQFERRGLL